MRPKTSAVWPTTPASRRTSGRPSSSGSSPRSRPLSRKRAAATRVTRRRCARSTPGSATPSPSPTLRFRPCSRPTWAFPPCARRRPPRAPRGAALRRAHPREPPRPDRLLSSRGHARAERTRRAAALCFWSAPRSIRTIRSSTTTSPATPRARGTPLRRSGISTSPSKRDSRSFELIDTDTDFDPIRQDEAFRKWLAAARPATPAPATP